ncbi:MAG: hypothetical protein NW224_14195 [Leptolyngbyaceae cyanobacterium bins.302]|nr:hypothetical protein [Leptolyngbyaceae cyanobacterium bins.302]
MEINASVDEQEHMVLAIVSSELAREGLVEWRRQHTAPTNNPNAVEKPDESNGNSQDSRNQKIKPVSPSSFRFDSYCFSATLNYPIP